MIAGLQSSIMAVAAVLAVILYLLWRPNVKLNDTVRVKRLSSLPKLAAQYVGQTGTVIRISNNNGTTQYRVAFPLGEAIYLESELELVKNIQKE